MSVVPGTATSPVANGALQPMLRHRVNAFPKFELLARYGKTRPEFGSPPSQPRGKPHPAPSGSPLRRRVSATGALKMTAWLDENCGADGWVMTPFGTRGALNAALSIYFSDGTPASGFVTRWRVGAKV